MELWVATANLEEIKEAYKYPIKGVLTNPSIISKEKLKWQETVRKMDSYGKFPIGLQVVSTKEEEILKEIKVYRNLVSNRTLHLKLPISVDVLKLVPFFKKMNYTVNITTITSISQAILSLENNIDYLSIYVGRITDNGGDGINVLAKVKEYSKKTGKNTKILAASIRNLKHFEQIALAGADAAAVPLDIIKEACKSKVTDKSIEGFKNDWNKVLGGEK